jgi:hypothetical protein
LLLTAVFLGSGYYVQSTIDERVAKITDSVNAVQHALDPSSHAGADATLPAGPAGQASDSSEVAQAAPVAAEAPTAGGEPAPDQRVDARISAYCHNMAESTGGSYVIEQGCRQQEVDAWRELSSARQAGQIPDDIYRYCTGAPFGDSYMMSAGCVKQEVEAKQSLGSK